MPTVAPIAPTVVPTQPPIIVVPAAAQVPVGSAVSLHVMSALGRLMLSVADPTIADAGADQATQIVTVSGKKPGDTVMTITDERNVSTRVAIHVAYNAGSLADS